MLQTHDNQAYDNLERHFRELEALGARELGEEAMHAEVQRSLDLRYTGQGYELNVPAGATSIRDFHDAHRKRYGYADEGRAVEIVNVRVRMTVKAKPVTLPRYEFKGGNGKQAFLESSSVFFDDQRIKTGIYKRDELHAGDLVNGPAIVVEYSATTVLPPRCTAAVDAYKNLVIEVA
jgi:N-methylhydantoinase A